MSPANLEQLNFRVSPRVLAPLGLEQLQDPALAVLELVKNSWDANATRVVIEINQRGPSPEITVSDNGFGMDHDDFRDQWLVIGSSHKRGLVKKDASRPIIGEKGLGRLASYALGSKLKIESAKTNHQGFEANVDWDLLLESPSVEDYKIQFKPKQRVQGTKIVIGKLKSAWTEENTTFLTTHAQFLTSVPGERFVVLLRLNGKRIQVADPLETISKIAEGEMEIEVDQNGLPVVVHCAIDGVNLTDLQFRDFNPRLVDSRLAESRLRLKFYRRDQAAKRLSGILNSNEVNDVLERYQGVRIYRDGINVPPYGLNGDDWASLEKQRTSTGGPTMVPGNSQLTGEFRVPSAAKHLVITAGRSGFSDQSAVKNLAAYVQWAVRELGTARRAKALGIFPGQGPVPGRVDSEKIAGTKDRTDARGVLRDVVDEQIVRRDPELRSKLNVAREVIERELDRNEQTLRLYAQLASTGIAATSFAHELRADFDVITKVVGELVEDDPSLDKELVSFLSASWARIVNFVALFKVVPVKVRRQRRVLTPASIDLSVEAVSKLAPPDKIVVDIVPSHRKLSLVPAELDSILLNLVSNAVKAVAESSRSGHGKIRIALVDHDKDLDVCVADNGCGISKKVADVMFEPLEGKFSEGTGMGLAIVKFIAERYQGYVEINRAPPKGYSTELRVRLRGVVK